MAKIIETYVISIHALRGEGDDDVFAYAAPAVDFNPRPPWGGRRLCQQKCALKPTFQSTPSVGRATQGYIRMILKRGNFNPRPPWGGRRCQYLRRSPNKSISIHALRGEGDREREKKDVALIISIHALRGEGDCVGGIPVRRTPDFNPRPPWGGRLGTTGTKQQQKIFQSTPSVGRATIS